VRVRRAPRSGAAWIGSRDEQRSWETFVSRSDSGGARRPAPQAAPPNATLAPNASDPLFDLLSFW